MDIKSTDYERYYFGNSPISISEIWSNCTPKLDQNYIKKASSLAKCLKNIYSENWNFIVSKRTGIILGIRIKFPKITISNTLLEQHLIEELFFDISLRNDLSLQYIQIFRGALTREELEKGYLHSHCTTMPLSHRHYPVSSLPFSSTVCFGQTDLKDCYERLRDLPFNIEDFGYLLFNLNTFAAHESIAGVPYITIGSLPINRNVTTNIDFTPYITSEEEHVVTQQIVQYLLKCIAEKGIENTDIHFRYIDNNIKLHIESVTNELSKIEYFKEAAPYLFSRKVPNSIVLPSIFTLLEEATEQIVSIPQRDVVYSWNNEVCTFKVIEKQRSLVLEDFDFYWPKHIILQIINKILEYAYYNR